MSSVYFHLSSIPVITNLQVLLFTHPLCFIPKWLPTVNYYYFSVHLYNYIFLYYYSNNSICYCYQLHSLRLLFKVLVRNYACIYFCLRCILKIRHNPLDILTFLGFDRKLPLIQYLGCFFECIFWLIRLALIIASTLFFKLELFFLIFY